MRRVFATATWIGIAVMAIWTLAPIAVMTATSLKPRDEIFAIPPALLPDTWTLDNYVEVFTNSSMPRAFLNSILAALLVTVMTIMLCGSVGYALARFRFHSARPV